MSRSATITSLAIAFPPTIRKNAWWEEHYPDLVRSASEQSLAKLWAREQTRSAFERAMAPYASDPFKGSKERRVLAEGETAVDLEAWAATEALAAAHYEPDDVDLVLVASMRPDTIAVGDAAFLVRRMGLRCPAVNLETACSSSVFGLDLACAMVSSGRHRRVLVVASCTYSRDIDPGDSLAWFLADGAGAFVVEAAPDGYGWMGSKSIHTAETCGAFVHELVIEDGKPRMKMRATRGAGAVLHDTAEPYLTTCCRGAADAAGVSLHEIDFFVFNTPTAWYADFGADVLGIERSRTISTYPIYTNIGPALMPANLYHAASEAKIREGDTVMLYSVGSASTAMALVLRWGDVALGTPPPR